VDFLLEILLWLLIYVLAYPVVGLLATPVIVIRSFWGPKSYLANLKHYYGRLFNWLSDALQHAG
jgi:hypothetical protein